MTNEQYNRVVELDWLRCILVFTVFLHHVGMPFNGDSFHIMNRESSKLLDDIMVYFEQFRMPMLFLISGAGASLFLHRYGALEYFRRRAVRLLLPFAMAVLLIVPPQNYIEHIDRYPSYLAVYPELALSFELNHLWFISFLLLYVLLTPAGYWLVQWANRTGLSRRLTAWCSRPWAMFAMVTPLVVLRLWLKGYFPEEDKHLGNLSVTLYYGLFYFAGLMLMAWRPLWLQLLKHRRANLWLLIVISGLFYGYYFSPDLSPYLTLQTRWAIWWALGTLLAWAAALTISGYAQRFLAVRPLWLNTANRMVYPFYICHQTVIVVLGYQVIQWQVGIGVKLLSLFLGALVVTLGCCALIFRHRWMHRLFGVG